ncbi:MAG TPA: kelch repeat-containing protein [Myxococcaceae bacterium]
MINRRSHHTTTLLSDGRILAAGGFRDTIENPGVESTALAEVYDPATGQWTMAELMMQYRYGHTATLLPSGKVLVVGGYAGMDLLKSAEVYDPVADTWTEVRPMRYSRGSHTATLLKNGKVLVVGGLSLDFLSRAELYDPVTDTWTDVGAIDWPRAFHTASLLPDGKVLVAGGLEVSYFGEFPLSVMFAGWAYPINLSGTFFKSAELFNPEDNSWTSAGADLAHARAGHTSTVLSDGKVLVVGGYQPLPSSPRISVTMIDMRAEGVQPLASVEAYEPDTKQWSPRAGMTTGRAFHTATLLPDGKLLVTTGNSLEPGTGGGTKTQTIGSTEVYDPASPQGAWLPAPHVSPARVLHTATLLPSGRVLLTGGYSEEPGKLRMFLTASQFLETVSRDWVPGPGLKEARHQLTATLLPGQGVLLAGGRSAPDGGGPLSSSEVFESTASSGASTLVAMTQARYAHSATLLPNGQVLVVGGYSEAKALTSAEVYDPRAGVWSRGSNSLNFPRGGHTATLLSDGSVLIVGGRDLSRTPFSEVELYEPSTGTWSVLTKSFLGRVGHTATRLLDGRVLVTGGSTGSSGGSNITSNPELYDPRTGQWNFYGERMTEPRMLHTATLLPSGKVLVTGGRGEGSESLASAELFDPADGYGKWRGTRSMKKARRGHTATLLPTGQVLVTGGYDESGTLLASAELYDPGLDSWSPAEPMKHPRAHHAVVLLPDGGLLVAGGDGTNGEPSTTELYRALHSQGQPPVLTQVNGISMSGANASDLPRVEPGELLAVRGERLRGQSEASSGDRGSSAANVPLLTLRSVDSGQWVQLRTHAFSDGYAMAILRSVHAQHQLHPGHYVLSVTAHAWTASQVIRITNDTQPELSFREVPLKLTRDTRATFSFYSWAEDLQSFECSLDRKSFESCDGSYAVANLSDGSHSVRVRALDWTGKTSHAPAEYSWEVDTIAPEFKLGSTVAKKTRERSVTFSFTSNENPVEFECSLDGADFTPCLRSLAYQDLPEGSHTLQVRAYDPAGNMKPDSYSWTIIGSYYDTGCSASGASPGQYWPWALLLLGLRRRPRLSRPG